MKARFIIIVPVLALAFATGFGCSSSSNKKHTGTGGTGGTAGAAGAGGALTDQCTDPTDLAAVQADYPGPDGSTVDMAGLATICGTGCLSQTDAPGCTKTCVQQKVTQAGGTLSDGCSECFVDSFICGASNCTVPCTTQSQDACNACLCQHGCIATFTTCSGDPTGNCVCNEDAGVCQSDGGAGAGGTAGTGGGGGTSGSGGAAGAMDASAG